MASACVNSIGVPPENFFDCPPSAFPAYGWLSPRISFSRDYTDEDGKIFAAAKPHSASIAPEVSDLFKTDAGDFEFRLDDPVTMLPADELFSDGKLVPLQLTAVRSALAPSVSEEEVVRSPEAKKSATGNEAERFSSDPYLFSPKAPRCSSHWRELLGLRKLQNKAASMSYASTTLSSSTSAANSSSNSTGKSIRHFLQRNSKSTLTSSASEAFNLPLLKDSDCESLSFSSSRLSLSSSSSSGHDHDDLPRFSIDADIRSYQPSRSSSGPNQSMTRPRMRLVKPKMIPASVAENPAPLIDHPSAPTTTATVTRGVSMDSPRLSSSGKIVYHGLERSSSSPSTFNGGPRYKHRGMERSYSANVRVTPVLNVPLCKSGVFGLFSSQSQKKEGSNGSTSTGSSKSHHHHHHHHSASTGRSRKGGD